MSALLSSVVEGQARIAQQQDTLEHRMNETERRFRERLSQQSGSRTKGLSGRGSTSRRGGNHGRRQQTRSNSAREEDVLEDLGTATNLLSSTARQAKKKLQVSLSIVSRNCDSQRITTESCHGGV